MSSAIVIFGDRVGNPRQVKGRSAIGQHPTEFAMQIGALCRRVSNGLGDGGVFWVQSLSGERATGLRCQSLMQPQAEPQKVRRHSGPALAVRSHSTCR